MAPACHTHPHKTNLQLNDGKKWKVNPEMKPQLRKASDLLSDFVLQQNTNYRQLAEALQAQNNALIQSCTMEGKSHDELNKWLHPHLELVHQLAKASDHKEASQLLSLLKRSFDTYHTYFE